MGKASKWIRNLFMGKREDKGKKTSTSVPAESCTSNTPKERRRWSFRISTNNKSSGHKSTKSFDSILMLKEPTFDCKTQKDNLTSPKLNAHAAATKIQAAYRSYLARRALRALRALVKLQALARGYLVRKQMNTVVRSIHAVMSIQVRARIHRIQTAEEPPAERVEYGSRVCSSARLSASQREYQLKMSSSPSTLSFTDSSSTTCDGQLEELSLKLARRNSRRYTENRHPFMHPLPQRPDYVPSNSNFVPNYMSNTKSSEAKARSHSEPKQRPKSNTKQKSKRSSSMDGKNDTENQYPWLKMLYRSDKSTDDGDGDSYIRAMVSASKHMNSINPFEVEPPPQLFSGMNSTLADSYFNH